MTGMGSGLEVWYEFLKGEFHPSNRENLEEVLKGAFHPFSF